MKKLIKALLLAMTLVTLLTVIPLPANASTSNKQKVFSYITEEMGLNSAAACGIMANIERESDFKPTCVIRDSNGKRSGGLCQWNGGRFSALQRYCNKKGLDYLSVEGQLAYLKYELSQDYYKHIYNYLKKVPNNSEGAYDAAYYWCYYFEIPASRATKSRQRGNIASKTYWPVFGNKKLDTPTIKTSTESADLDSSITLSWSSGGKNATSYKLYVAEKDKDGNYDWDNAKIYKPTSTKQKIKAKSLGEGSFAAYVKAVNGATGGSSKKSNTIKFSISCKEHDYETYKVTKNATLTTTGKKTLICVTCGDKTTATIKKLTGKDVEGIKMSSAPKATARGVDSITLSWGDYKGADGYRLYVKDGDSWKKIYTVDKDGEKSFRYTGLKAATEYKFRVRFFVKDGDKTYYSKASATYTTSTKTLATTLKSVTGHNDGTADLKWTKVKGADMYAIYACTPMTNKDDYKLLCYVKGNKTSHTVDGLKRGTYSFIVKAVVKCDDQKIYSAASNSKSALVL